MATIEIRFPGGIYHGTPPGHHVNEGLVEWPPSPWRLVRALLATGYTKLHWGDSLPLAARRLLEGLASVLPEYRLPKAVLGHSRHYMPMAALDNGRDKPVLVLDTFADVGEGSIFVRWPISLDDEAAVLLAKLVENMGYLGRSESWVVARTLSEDAPLPDAGRCWPHHDSFRPERGFEQISLLAPEIPERFHSWLDTERQAIVPAEGVKLTAKQKKDIAKSLAPYPADLLDALQWDTERWRSHRWSQAPGSRRVLYWRESNALEVGPPVVAASVRQESAQAVLLSLTTRTGSRSALPPIARTLPQAELLHQAAVQKLNGVACPELIGRDPASGARLTGHTHAYVLPLDLNVDGHIDHVLLFARNGLGPDAMRSIRAVKKTYMKGGAGELQVALIGSGQLDSFCRLPPPIGTSINEVIGAGCRWVSATPFVPPRYLKRSGQNALAGQVNAELASHGFPAARVEVLPWDVSPSVLAMRHFVRRRRPAAPQPPVDVGFALSLEFAETVSGPLSIGYGAHFGLGRFRIAEAATVES